MKILTGKKAVLFDLDGTLVDSMWLWKEIDIEYLRQFQIPFEESLQQEINGRSFTETAIYIKNKYQITDSIETMMKQWNDMAFNKYRYEVPLKPGVRALLEWLKKNHIPMGIASSNSRELVDTVLEALSIDSYFQSIRTSCEVEAGKPSPDIYLLVAKDLKVTPKDCLVFEDVVPGILAGLNAGMKVCAVWDKNAEAETEEKKRLAHWYLSSMEELKEELQ